MISVSTRFIRDWITSRYLDQILQIIKSYKRGIERIEFTISEKTTNGKDQNQKISIGPTGDPRSSYWETIISEIIKNVIENSGLFKDKSIYKEKGFNYIADITYIPKNIYDNIITYNYKNIRVIDPY